MSEAAAGEEWPTGSIGEAPARQSRAGAGLQKPLLALLRRAQRALDATGLLAGAGSADCHVDGSGDRNDDSAAADLPELLASINSVLLILGMAPASWQDMAPGQIARFLLTLELQLQFQEELKDPPACSAAAGAEQQSGRCDLMLRQAARRLRLICSGALGAAHDQLASLDRQSGQERRGTALSQTAATVSCLRSLRVLLPAVFDAGAAGGRTSHLSRLAILMARRELKGLHIAGFTAGQGPADQILGRLLQQITDSLQGFGVGSESYEQLVKNYLNYGIQRQARLQNSLVDAGSHRELSCCFLEELSSSLKRLRAEWRALSAKRGLYYLCGWHCAWVSRLTTAALICADVPRHDLLEAWRTLLCWQFERSEPLRQQDLQLFDEVCAALAPDVCGTDAPETGMTACREELEARLAAALCVREVSAGVMSGQVPVSLAQNIRALLTASADIRERRDLPVSPVPGRRLLVELRLLTAGARALGVYRVETLSGVLAEVHLMLARAGDPVLESGRQDLLAEAHARLRSCLNCAAAHQEVPDCRELIATLYRWLDAGITGVSRSHDDLVQPAGIAPDADERHVACFQREAVGLVEAIDDRIAALMVPAAPHSEIPACPQLLSLLHTLKGGALQFDSVVIADLCHGLEQLLLRKPAPEEAGTCQGSPPSAELRRYASDLRAAIDDLGRRQAMDSGARVALPADDSGSLPIPARALTRIAGLAEQLGHCSRAMLDVLSTMEGAEVNASGIGVLRDLLGEQERHAVQLTEEIAGSRTVCFDRLSARLHRLAARHANELDRQVWFQVQGGELQMDRLLLERLVAPLEHLLRNAIDHGIESVAERRAASKPDCGSITLRVTCGAGLEPQWQIDLTDDGRGIEAGISGSMVEADERLQRLFAVGFSTRERVTAQGGHGLGLAAVKGAIDALNGSIRVSSRPGAGTCFHIALPV